GGGHRCRPGGGPGRFRPAQPPVLPDLPLGDPPLAGWGPHLLRGCSRAAPPGLGLAAGTGRLLPPAGCPGPRSGLRQRGGPGGLRSLRAPDGAALERHLTGGGAGPPPPGLLAGGSLPSLCVPVAAPPPDPVRRGAVPLLAGG